MDTESYGAVAAGVSPASVQELQPARLPLQKKISNVQISIGVYSPATPKRAKAGVD